jgi:hypothetical protein
MSLAQLIAEGLIQTELDRARERAARRYARRPRRRKRRIRLPLALARQAKPARRAPNGRTTVFG